MSAPQRPYRGMLLAFLALLVLGLAMVSSGSTERQVKTEARDADDAIALAPAQPRLEVAGDGLAIKPADPQAAVPEGPLHPHPITKAHERIFRENNLVGALNLAVDLEDPVRIREVLATYRAEYPEDDHRLQGGYEVIADCLDRPGDASRARAQDYWETQIRSQNRRYVRRYCLER